MDTNEPKIDDITRQRMRRVFVPSDEMIGLIMDAARARIEATLLRDDLINSYLQRLTEMSEILQTDSLLDNLQDDIPEDVRARIRAVAVKSRVTVATVEADRSIREGCQYLREQEYNSPPHECQDTREQLADGVDDGCIVLSCRLTRLFKYVTGERMADLQCRTCSESLTFRTWRPPKAEELAHIDTDGPWVYCRKCDTWADLRAALVA